jgi:hypothetical protein
MFKRLMHATFFGTLGGATSYVVMHYVLGQDPPNFSVIWSITCLMALMGLLFGYEAADTFKSLMHLR